VSGLDWQHIQQREGRWLLADLIGKQGRIRSVPIPEWAYAAVSGWREAAGLVDGPVFRSLTRHGYVAHGRLSSQAVFLIVKSYAKKLGISASPHDLRRTFAKLAHVGRSPLEQIQLSLGHASVVTTEMYLGVKQDLRDAPCDRLELFRGPTPVDLPAGSS
jgi:integrase